MTTMNKVLEIIAILFVIVVAVFIVRMVCSEITSSAAAHNQVIDAIDDNPNSIILHGFDEQLFEISDEEEVKEIIKTLKQISYEEKAKPDYVEGSYHVEIDYDDKTISLGLGRDFVAYDGIQYDIERGSLDNVIGILARHLE